MSPAETGKADGAKWAARVKVSRCQLSPIAVAQAAGMAHLRKVEAGKLAVSDVVSYCQAFIDSALAALGDRCAWG